jgi:hypothetical protein
VNIFYRILILSFAFSSNIYSQGHQWWADNVGWDGHRHFESYILLNSAHMGPNAFFMPSSLSALIDSNSFIKVSANTHFTAGEVTLNPFVTWNISFGPRASLQISGVPIEYFNTSHELKTERKIFHLNYDDNTAAGDIRFMFCGQLAKNPDIAMYVGIKTASGTKLGAARYTDTPQYFVNLSAGFGNEDNNIYGTAGFTAWQTYDPTHNQDDGYTYGIGYSRKLSNNWFIKPELYGIIAYLKNGDRPMIFLVDLIRKIKRGELNIAVTKGIFDFPYTTLSLGYRYNFINLK